jgi:fructoselysine and glucoselysine-specific PTS system IIA component
MTRKTITRKFLIATHGALAKGIQSSLEIIIGATENLFTIQAYLEGNQSIEEELYRVMEKISAGDELIIFSDLLGGSVNSQILRYALRENVHVISGFNLPLVMEIVLADPEIPIPETIRDAIVRAKDQMAYVNDLIALNSKKSEND